MNKRITRYSNDLAVDFGFKQADEYYLRHYDNPVANPPCQIFSYSEPEEEEPGEINNNTKVCPKCENFDLKYSYVLPGRYFCYSCGHKEEVEKAPSTEEIEPIDLFLPLN